MSASIGAGQEALSTSVADASARQESRLQAIEGTQEAILGQMASAVPSSPTPPMRTACETEQQ
jgi:hypothetical protein